MIWLYILLGLVFLFLLLFYLLRFDFTFSMAYPIEVKGAFRFSFLWIKRSGEFSTGADTSTEAKTPAPLPEIPASTPFTGQAGFLRLPSFPALRTRLKQGAFKFGTDFQVWGALARFGGRSLGFFRKSLRARLRYLGLGFEDPVLLGYMAGGYSALAGFYPGLRCPVHYYFNRSHITFGLKIRGKFTGLHILIALLRCFLAFPWFFLTGRFLGSVRDTSLNWWQEKIYGRLAPR